MLFSCKNTELFAVQNINKTELFKRSQLFINNIPNNYYLVITLVHYEWKFRQTTICVMQIVQLFDTLICILYSNAIMAFGQNIHIIIQHHAPARYKGN